MRCILAILSLLLLLGCTAHSGKLSTDNVEPTTETVTYASGEETVKGFLCRPSGVGPFPGLLMIHDDFGLTDWVKDQAKRLAGQGYVVLAIDLYRGEAVSNLLDAHIMDRGVPEDRALRDLKAAVDYLAKRKDVRESAGRHWLGHGRRLRARCSYPRSTFARGGDVLWSADHGCQTARSVKGVGVLRFRRQG